MTWGQWLWVGVVCWWAGGMVTMGARLPVTGEPTAMFEGPTLPGLIGVGGILVWMFFLCVDAERRAGGDE